MRIYYLLIFVAFFACTNKSNKQSYQFTTSIEVDLSEDKINVIKYDPSIGSLEAGIRKLVFERMLSDKIEILQSGKQSKYSELKDQIIVNRVDTVNFRNDFEFGIITTRNSIWKDWSTLVLNQKWKIDLNKKSVQTGCLNYSVKQESYNGEKYSNFTFVNNGVATKKMDINKIINNEKYVWIAQVETDVLIRDIQFEGNEKSEILSKAHSFLFDSDLPTYNNSSIGDTTTNKKEHFLHPNIDTVITFDPETYDENVQVLRYKPFDFENLQKIKLIQLLCFNNEDSSFEAYVIGLSVFQNSKNGVERNLFTIK